MDQDTLPKTSLAERDLVDTKLNTSQKHALAAGAKGVLVALRDHLQQVEGGAPSPLLSTGEATPRGLCPVLGSPVQETWTH